MVSKVLYIEGLGVTHQEERAWIRLAVAVAAYAVYVAVVLGRAGTGR